MAVTPPKQARARQTFDRILDAAAELLLDKGIEGLNTNEAATRAGVNISTLYRYFDDKYDLVEGLLSRFSELQMAEVAQQMPRFDDPRERLSHILDLQLQLMERHPWLGAVQRALRASPQLRAARAANKARTSALMLENIQWEGLNARGPFTLAERRKPAAQLLVEIWGTGLQTVAEAPEAERQGLLAELKVLLNAYLDTMALS
jgi:AcrR family transcriptional regulator